MPKKWGMGRGREELKEHSTRHRVLNQEPGTKPSLRSLTIYPQTLSLEYAINMTLTPNLFSVLNIQILRSNLIGLT